MFFPRNMIAWIAVSVVNSLQAERWGFDSRLSELVLCTPSRGLLSCYLAWCCGRKPTFRRT